MAEKQATEFQFVNATIETPTAPQDLAIRALIRKQAMKKASAARKRDGNYGKHNLRQYPVFLFDQPNTVDIHAGEQKLEKEDDVQPRQQVRVLSIDGSVKAKLPRSKSKNKEKERQQWVAKQVTESIPQGLSARGYELTSMKSDFDILNLSTLSTLHVNRMARRALSQNPYHLIHQLRSCKQGSYLSFLPSMYGQIPCLSHATDCVIARARQIISPNRNWEAAVITFYVRALDSLQKALDCPKQRFKPEVLCATEILALYELLDPAGETAWIRHAAGAARLIQLRGPENYTTDFEKALFMAHTGPIMTECLFNNERCFLEQDAWHAVFRSAILEDALISDRSAIVIELMILKSNIPGLFHDVTNILYSPDPDSAYINSTTNKLCKLREDMVKWNASYEYLLSCVPPIYPGSAEYDRRCKVYATYLSCMILPSRLLGALNPTERVELEEETQIYTNQMLDLELEVNSTSSAAAMFMAQTFGVAQATVATSEAWLQGEILRNGDRSGSGSISEQLHIEKLESVSPEGFTSEAGSSDGPPSAGLYSETFSQRGPPSAAFSSSDGPPSADFSSARFSLSTAPSLVSDRTPEPRGLLERWKFEKWCAAFGRKMPS